MTRQRRLIVETPNEQIVLTASGVTFDGGALIVFADERLTDLVMAFGPGAWGSMRWEQPNEVQT